MPASKPLERNISTDADIKLLLEKATPSVRIAIVLAASGTLRLGEVCALKYEDILREQSSIRVHTDMVSGKRNPVLSTLSMVCTISSIPVGVI